MKLIWWKPIRTLRVDGTLYWYDAGVLNLYPDKWLPQIRAMPPGREISLEIAWNYASAASSAAFDSSDAKRCHWLKFNWVEFCQQEGFQIVLMGTEYTESEELLAA
jgi:hypothetical protein